MVQATTSDLSKIFRCSRWLARSGDLVSKWIVKGSRVRDTCSVLRVLGIAETAMSLVLLWPSIQLDMNV